jgi:hypothetical protein
MPSSYLFELLNSIVLVSISDSMAIDVSCATADLLDREKCGIGLDSGNRGCCIARWAPL